MISEKGKRKMKLNKKKGFTIIELVIVIAVIGVLTAVLVPVFVNLTNRANEAADQSLVKNLNTALATQEADPEDEKNNTLHDAVEDLKKYGFLLENLAPKSDKEFVWNRHTNRFVFTTDPAINENNKYDFFKIQKSIDAEQKFSVYASNDFAMPNGELVLNGFGFDTGYKEGFENISYTNSGSARTVVIRTNGAATNLKVTAKNDTVHHYDLTGTADIVETADASYHEHGTAGYVQVASGRVVAENGGKIETVVLTAPTTSATLPAVIEQKAGGEITNKYATTNAVASANNGEQRSVQLTLRTSDTEEGKGNILFTSTEETAAASMSQEDLADLVDSKTEDIKEEAVEEVTPIVEKIITSFGQLYDFVAGTGDFEGISKAKLGSDISKNSQNANSPIEIHRSITIDLAGHSIVGWGMNDTDQGFDVQSVFWVKSDGEFTINDSVGGGYMESTSAGPTVWNDGIFTITGGKLVGAVLGFPEYGITFPQCPFTNHGTANTEGYKYYQNDVAFDTWPGQGSAVWTFEKR